jgi:hypothetical protein
MKRYLSILMVLVISVMVMPSFVSAEDSFNTLELENKNTETWQPILGDSKYGLFFYYPSGDVLRYALSGVGLESNTAYSLIYYANPYPGDNPGLLITTGTTDADGAIDIPFTDKEIGIDLPTAPDSNMVVAHNVPPDNYDNAYGAKIWLVPSYCYDEDTNSIISWEPDKFLFETDLINYTDTNKTGGTDVGLTVTVEEPTADLSFIVDKSNLNFGSVVIGQCSTSQIITITNDGNVPITVTVTPSAGFYTTSLKLGGVGTETLVPTGGWVTTTIAEDGSYSFSAIVCPLAGLSGTQTGTLTFMAEYAP